MSVRTLTANILSKMQGIKKWQEKFIVHLFPLLLGLRGRMNFENMSRQSEWNESSYRNNYAKSFDFMSFNQHLIDNYCSQERIIVFDPSFIRKSGKHTSGLGYFWSGVAGRAEKGLEIGGFAVVDIENNTAMHLSAHQTHPNKSEESLLSGYAKLLENQSVKLLKQSSFLVADAYFSKKEYVQTAIDCGFTFISKLRCDAILRYPYLGEQKKGRGRPRKFVEGKFKAKDLDFQYFTLIDSGNNFQIFEAKLWIKSLECLAKVVVIHYLDEQKKVKRAKIYFATDPELCGKKLLTYYKARFQIEFLYRDAKQFAGLNDCQSRKKERLHFHFNTSLTLVSLAKAAHYLSIPKDQRKAFSLSSIKTQYINEHFLDRFFCVFGDIPDTIKNSPLILELINFGAIAA